MKKQFIAAFIGLTVTCSQAFAYLGPNDKDYKPTAKPKANCSPATAKLTMKFQKEVTALQFTQAHSGWVVPTSTDSSN